MAEITPKPEDKEAAAAKRAEWSARIEGLVKACVMAFIGLAAGRAAFTHMHDWTMESSPPGTPDWFGWSNAIISELIPLVALLDIRAKRRAGKTLADAKFAVSVLVVFVLLSLAAQISQALHTPPGWLIAALPALGFLVVTKLVLAGKPTMKTAPEQAIKAKARERPAPVPASEPTQVRPVPPVPAVAEPPAPLVPVVVPREDASLLGAPEGPAAVPAEPEPIPVLFPEPVPVEEPTVIEPVVLDMPDDAAVRERLGSVGLGTFAPKVGALLRDAASEGRAVTVADLAQTVRLPLPLAEKAYTALNGYTHVR